MKSRPGYRIVQSAAFVDSGKIRVSWTVRRSVRTRDSARNRALACLTLSDLILIPQWPVLKAMIISRWLAAGAARASHENGGCVLFWPWACWSACAPSAHAATVHHSKPRHVIVRHPTFRRSAGQVRRHPQQQRSIQIWRRLICGDLFSVGLRRSARSLNLGMSCADTTLLGNLRDPVPKPTPPSDHIPLRRRCAFWCRPVPTRQWPNLVFAVAWFENEKSNAAAPGPVVLLSRVPPAEQLRP